MLARFKNFRSDDDGSSTIEFLFWVPVMVGLVALTVDAVLVMNQIQTMNNIARDASRSVAVGANTPSQAETALNDWSQATGSNVVIVDGGDGFVTTTISTPFASVGNITSHFLSGNMQATAVMWIEGSNVSGS